MFITSLKDEPSTPTYPSGDWSDVSSTVLKQLSVSIAILYLNEPSCPFTFNTALEVTTRLYTDDAKDSFFITCLSQAVCNNNMLRFGSKFKNVLSATLESKAPC